MKVFLGYGFGNPAWYLSISKRVLVRMYENQASLITKEIMKEISGTYLKPLVGDCHREMGLPVDVVVFAEDEKTCRLKMKRAVKKLRELVQKKHAQ